MVTHSGVGTTKGAPGKILEKVHERTFSTINTYALADAKTPVLAMISGGSDSTALAYVCEWLVEQGAIGPLAFLHVNHNLRGKDSDDDQVFVQNLANTLGVSLSTVSVHVGDVAQSTGGNVEAVGRRERYRAADSALDTLCREAGVPRSQGRIFTAHTADDRVENFYMRSIVGAGPGGFRSMKYRNGPVVRPLMDLGRQDLRDYIRALSAQGADVVRDDTGALWREDATNAHTDRFRAYVRAEIVPRARERNPRLLDTLSRTMNLIADEDDMLEDMATEVSGRYVRWIAVDGSEAASTTGYGCIIDPEFGRVRKPLARRCVLGVLQQMLGADARIESASVEAVLSGFADGAPVSGYTDNIQGDLAVSANKKGLRIEPMAIYRARRKKD